MTEPRQREPRVIDPALMDPDRHDPAPTREGLAVLLKRLRGSVPVAEVARRLKTSRQSVMELERGWDFRKDKTDEPAYWHITNPTLQRLEQLGEAFGVDFVVVARDRKTGQVILRDAPGLQTEPT